MQSGAFESSFALETFTATFNDGPMGIWFELDEDDNFVVTRSEGCAAAEGVEPGDRITEV